jgi:hypothetical protein
MLLVWLLNAGVPGTGEKEHGDVVWLEINQQVIVEKLL